MKYSVKNSTYVKRASNAKLIDAEPSILLNKGDEINGNEYYIILGKGKGMKRVVKVSSNRYISFDDIKSPESQSGLILPPTFFAGDMQQEGYSYYTGAGKFNLFRQRKCTHVDEKGNVFVYKCPDGTSGIVGGFMGSGAKTIGTQINGSEIASGFNGVLPPNNLAVDTASGFEGVLPPNNIAIDWQRQNGVYYSSDEGEETVVELTPEQVKEQHKASGSKKSFNDWVKAEGKGWLAGFGSQIADLLDKKKPAVGTKPAGGKPKDGDKKPTKIMGMHPVTFTLVAIGTIGVIGYVAFGRKGVQAKA